MNDYVKLGLWAVLIVAAFGFLWYKGYLLRLSNYVMETREELRKCTWPSFEELKGSTVVVAIATVLLAAFTVLADFIITFLVRKVSMEL